MPPGEKCGLRPVRAGDLPPSTPSLARKPGLQAVTGSADRHHAASASILRYTLLSLPEPFDHGLFVGRFLNTPGFHPVDELVDLSDEKAADSLTAILLLLR